MNNSKRSNILISVVLTVGCSCLCYAQQPAPILIPFQGRLMDSAGFPVPDGTRLILFKIYDQPSGGNVVWPGELHQTSVNAGLVNVLLGSKVLFGEDFDFSRQLYLEVTVDVNGDDQITAADPPMLPRQSVVPAPFASRASVAETALALNEEAVVNRAAAADFAINANTATVADLARTVRGDALYVHDGGNVGIGTNAPDFELEVIGDVKAATYYGDGSNLTGIATVDGIRQALNVTPTSDTTTNSTSFVDFAGMSTTINTTGDSTLLVFWNCTVFQESQGAGVVTEALVDGVRVGPVQGGAYSGNSTNQYESISGHCVAPVSDGAHTVKIRWRVTKSHALCNPTSSPDLYGRTLTVIEIGR